VLRSNVFGIEVSLQDLEALPKGLPKLRLRQSKSAAAVVQVRYIFIEVLVPDIVQERAIQLVEARIATVVVCDGHISGRAFQITAWKNVGSDVDCFSTKIANAHFIVRLFQ